MKIKVFVLLLFVSAQCAWAQVETPVKVLKGEKWWGVYVDGAPLQPLSPQTKVNSRGLNRVPLLLSSSGRYICSDTPIKVEMEPGGMTVISDKTVEIESSGKNLREAYIIACHKNFAPTLTMPASELFSKVVYYTSAELRANDNQQSLIAYVDRLIAEGFPKGIVVVSDGWNAQPGEFSFDQNYYPAPKQMVDELHARGFKVMLSVSPYAPTWGRNYIEYKVKSSLVTAPDGSVVVARADEGYFTLLDMRSPSIVDNMESSLGKLQRETGVDGYVFDYRAVYGVLKGSDMDRFEKGMTSLASAFDMTMVNASPTDRYTPYGTTLETRGGKVFDDLNTSLCSALSSSLMGYSWFAMEAPGEVKTMKDAELLRSIQLSLFMPIAVVPFAPWRIGDNKLYQEVRRNINLRSTIGAEVAAQAKESSRNGEPLIRMMEYQFPREGFSDCPDQYIFAGKYLIAPVVSGATSRLIRVPKGSWKYADGSTIRGPRVVSIDVAGGRMGVLELVGR